MNLFFNGRKLLKTKTISQCGISIFSSLVQKKVDIEEIYGIQKTTKPDCLTFDDDSNQMRALMPCGHAVSQQTLILILQSLIDAKKYEIKCPVKKGEVQQCGYTSNELCDTTWPYELCRKVGVLTSEEKKKFEAGIEESYVMKGMGGKQCPACDIADNRVRCSTCVSKNQAFDFCWQCLKRWQSKNAFTKQYPCGNYGCCGTKKIGEVEGVPELRACPKCQTLINHINNCKHMTCEACKIQFCFVCLSIQEGGKWKYGSYSSKCAVVAIQKF